VKNVLVGFQDIYVLDLLTKFVSRNSVKIRAYAGPCNTNPSQDFGTFRESAGRNFGVYANLT